MFKRIITFNQTSGESYYNEYIIDTFPHVSNAQMMKMINKGGFLRSTGRLNAKHRVVINGIRVSIRRCSIILMLLNYNTSLYFEYKEGKFVIQDENFIVDFPEYMDKKKPVERKDLIITHK